MHKIKSNQQNTYSKPRVQNSETLGMMTCGAFIELWLWILEIFDCMQGLLPQKLSTERLSKVTLTLQPKAADQSIEQSDGQIVFEGDQQTLPAGATDNWSSVEIYPRWIQTLPRSPTKNLLSAASLPRIVKLCYIAVVHLRQIDSNATEPYKVACTVKPSCTVSEQVM